MEKEYCLNEGCGMPYFHCECELKGLKFKSSYPREYIACDDEFTHNGIHFMCVGRDNGMVWGVVLYEDEPKAFEPSECVKLFGLHQKYVIRKVVIENGVQKEVEVDENAEYFVLRIDDNAKDKNVLYASRHAIRTFANKLSTDNVALATDLLNRYKTIPIKSHNHNQI